MIKLVLNRDIYSDDNIKKVQKLYGDLATIEIETFEKGWILIFTDCLYDESITVREFENYLIGLENS